MVSVVCQRIKVFPYVYLERCSEQYDVVPYDCGFQISYDIEIYGPVSYVVNAVRTPFQNVGNEIAESPESRGYGGEFSVDFGYVPFRPETDACVFFFIHLSSQLFHSVLPMEPSHELFPLNTVQFHIVRKCM